MSAAESERAFDPEIVSLVDDAVARDDPTSVEADLQDRLPAGEGVGRVHEALAYLRREYPEVTDV